VVIPDPATIQDRSTYDPLCQRDSGRSRLNREYLRTAKNHADGSKKRERIECNLGA